MKIIFPFNFVPQIKPKDIVFKKKLFFLNMKSNEECETNNISF